MKNLFFLKLYDQWSYLVYKSYYLLLFLLSSQVLYGQSSVVDNYIAEGIENNHTLQQNDHDIQKSIAALQESKGLFYPKVSFEANYSLAGGGRTIAIPVGDLMNPVYATLNQLTDSQQFPQISNVDEQFLPNNFHETKIRVIQPLFNTDIYYNYKAKEALISIEQAKRKVYEQELGKDIKKAYFQYLQTLEVIKVYGDTKTLLKEVLKFNEKLVKHQKATSEVIYSSKYEIQKIEKDLVEAEKNRILAQSYFNFLLNKPLESDIIADSTLLNNELLMKEYSLANLESQSLEERKVFEQIEKGRYATLQRLKMNEASIYPTVNLVGDVGYQGFEYKFDNTQDFWFVQVALSWNIFSGKQKRYQRQQIMIEQKKLDTQEAQVQNQVKLQVRQAFHNLESSKQSIETSKAALRSAEENFKLVDKQYKQDRTPLINLLDAQTKLNNAKVAIVIDKYSLLLQLVELERAIGI